MDKPTPEIIEPLETPEVPKELITGSLNNFQVDLRNVEATTFFQQTRVDVYVDAHRMLPLPQEFPTPGPTTPMLTRR